MTAGAGASLLVERAAEVLLRASRHPLAPRISRGLSAAGIGPDDAMLLLVSGGSDSMAMLVAIAALRSRCAEFPAGLAVLSVDHGLRAAAAGEVESVLASARDLGITETHARRVELARGANVLDAAREARYAVATALSRTLGGIAAGGVTLVVAHQAEDRAESHLMALARREGLAACTKLMPRREFPDWAGARVARPLLDCTRAELRSFLRDCGVRWIEDPSNAEHRRGAMRTDPSLRGLVEEIAAGLSIASDEAAELMSLRDELVAGALSADGVSCPRDAFDALPAAVRRAIVLRIAQTDGVSIAHAVLVAASSCEARAVRRFACPDGCELVLGRDRVAIARPTASERQARPRAGAAEAIATGASGTRP